MATTAEKFDALGYLITGTIVILALAYLGSPLWGAVLPRANGGITAGSNGAPMSIATQPITMWYYGFLIVCEIALLARTGFIIFSRVDYQTGEYDI